MTVPTDFVNSPSLILTDLHLAAVFFARGTISLLTLKSELRQIMTQFNEKSNEKITKSVVYP